MTRGTDPSAGTWMPEADLRVRHARGGWWHEYVCPVHHCELDIAVTDTDSGAEHYPCPHGCQLMGEPYRSAWTALHHQRTARRLRLQARRHHRDATPGALEEAHALLVGFADLYVELAPGHHDGARDWMLAGRLFQQALTEAIWTASIADAVLELNACLSDEQRHLLTPSVPLLTSLHDAAYTARTVLIDRGDLRSNYTAWLDAAGAMAGQALEALGEPPALKVDWIEGPAGLVEHARAAVLTDGWEWEASTYYHAFVLRAYLVALRGYHPGNVPPELATTIGAMVGVVTDLVQPDGALPALHDTPYAREAMHAEFAETFSIAGQLFDAPALRRIVSYHRSRQIGDDGLLDVIDGWFAGPPLPGPADRSAASIVHRDAGYGVLRTSGLTAVVDFGPHGGSHGHLDKLSLYLYGPSSPWQPDPGVPPYASALRHGYYARTLAHPTFSCGGADQRQCAGALLWFDARDDQVELVVSADDAYPDVRARRQLVATVGYLLDVVAVSGSHAPVTLALRPDVETTVRWQAPNVLLTTWSGEQTLRGWHIVPANHTVTSRPGHGPADDPQRVRTHVDLTVTELAGHGSGRAAVFLNVWQAEPGDADLRRPDVTGVRCKSGVVHVDLSDGTTRSHVLDLGTADYPESGVAP